MTRLALVTIVLFTCAAGVGCAPAGRPPFAVGASAMPEGSTTCPFGLRGARVTTRATEGGVVIALRAFGNVEELRARAHHAAAMYGPGAHRGLGHDGAHGGGHRHGLGLAQLGMPVHAEAEDTAEGARIIVRPQHATDLERMRVALQEREGRARAGECP